LIAGLGGGEVRQVRLAPDLSPQQVARQVMRALHQRFPAQYLAQP